MISVPPRRRILRIDCFLTQNGAAPLSSAYGATDIMLYTGSALQQVELAKLGSVADPAKDTEQRITIDPSWGRAFPLALLSLKVETDAIDVVQPTRTSTSSAFSRRRQRTLPARLSRPSRPASSA